MRAAVYDYGVPLFYALPPVLLGMIGCLFLDPTFHLQRELRRRISLTTLASILLIFIAGTTAVVWGVAAAMPERLFALAAERPGKWLKIMTLYPFTSVLAQEIVYRVFFFHRYGPLFPNRTVLIVANALAFGFAHILFRNWIAVAGTLAGGLLFAWRYERTRSFWAVWFEHTLWGWLVFTVGLGVFFFTGVKNPAW
jgi:membrane protease YdiL (CAAX protease family)